MSVPDLELKHFHSCLFFLFNQTSDLWNKRHSVAIGDVNECKLIRRKEITPKQVDHIWKSMTVAQYVTLLHNLLNTLTDHVVCLVIPKVF